MKDFVSHVKFKQHATEEPMGQRRNKKRIKKYYETSENGNTPRFIGCGKRVITGKFIGISVYLMK